MHHCRFITPNNMPVTYTPFTENIVLDINIQSEKLYLNIMNTTEEPNNVTQKQISSLLVQTLQYKE